MKIFGILAFALGVSAQYDYDDMGNKKNKGTEVDKGPRECGGVKANDMGNLTWSCRSRNKKNGKTKGNTKHCKAQCPDGWKVQTGGQGTDKIFEIYKKKILHVNMTRGRCSNRRF